ncbi:hypothetical protein GCM10017608_27120 [Agromyces luteolus]|uniref:DUF1761 family protein n=1 Tax=Agromyces luteolus TaxID=88373 RepID=A0A7C9HWZ4_9MICO|nr:DUF1761 family protein [Agromyces luteolus]MUN06180.1 DUF1761 family protein [Agromyces luteolus]GLK28777.1 hypothetical protein GCM10017608_27120 [Agromyces luteolus]
MVVLGVAIATVASFIASAALYAVPRVAAVVASASTPRPGIPVPMQMAAVLLRSLLVAALVAGLLIAAGWSGAAAGAVLGLALAVLPAVLLMGAVIHENVPIPVAAIHLLDWAIKLVLIGAIVGVFA